VTTSDERHQQMAVVPIAPVERVAPGRKTRKKRSPWPARLSILVLLAGGVFFAARSLKPTPLVVETVQSVRGTVQDEISSSTAGEVLAERQVTVRSETTGRVLEVRHKRGERVKKGELIVVVNAADPLARLRQAEATLKAQRAQLAQSEAQVAVTIHTAERTKRLADHGAETTKAAEDAATEARDAQAAVDLARARVEESQAALQVARVARTQSEITAPFDGLLADVPVNDGDTIQPGTEVFELVDDSRLYVEALIDEADIGRVRTGQPALLRLDALPNRPVAGVVSKLDPTVRSDDKGARTLRLEVEVENLVEAISAGIRPGMSANVDVRVAEKANVVSLPTSVVIGRGTKRSVYVLEAGFVREKPIQIGLSSWERTEIVSGVAEGAAVVSTLNVKGLVDGAAARVGKDERP
jgi:HlyD family secretion protein